MRGYERYGEFELERAKREEESLDKKYYDLVDDKRDIEQGKKLYSEDYKVQALYDVNRGILSNRYRDAISGYERLIASANIEHKKKKVKFGRHGRIGRYVKRIKDYNTVLGCMEKLDHNPSITGELTHIYKDHEDIRLLDEITDVIYRDDDKLRGMPQQMSEVLRTIEEVTKSFRDSLRQIDKDFNNALYQMKVYVEKKKVSFGGELVDYKISLNNLSNKNENIAYFDNMVYQKAKDAVDGLRTKESYSYKMERLSSNAKVDKGIISANLPMAELVEFIEMAIEYLRRFSHSQANKNYGGYTFDIKEAIAKSNEAITKLNQIKKQLEQELEQKGFNKEVESMNTELFYGDITNILANLYVKLENTTGTARREIENDIENVLINHNIPEHMWDRLKFDAQGIADQKRQEKEAEISSKFREMRTKEKREIAIAHRELVSDAEIERFKRDAEIAAQSRFPVNYQQKNGDFYDMNSKERAEFIERYVSEQASKLAAMRFDDKERDVRVEERAFMEYTDEMAREGLTPEMVELAAEEMQRDGKLTETDLTKLSAVEVKYIVDYAKKLKDYSAIEDDMELAEAMARDKAKPGAEVTKNDIIIQFNFNQRYNVRNRLKSMFTPKENGPKL